MTARRNISAPIPSTWATSSEGRATALKSEYRIAGISIPVDAPTELTDNEGFSLYRVAPGSSAGADRVFSIVLTPEASFAVPNFEGAPVFSDSMHLVLQQGEQVLHLFRIPGTKGVSAWNWITPGSHLEIHYHPTCAPYYLGSVGCFNAAGIERILYSQGMQLFHCSCIDVGGSAVLFSAPSGGGKTTQALLWEQFGGATMVNGDRAVLERRETGYYAHGLPIAGSSGVFLNRSLPIKAVFVVKKALQNKALRLTEQEAFQAIFSELTINTWNHPFVLSAVDFSMEMAARVPVFRLECRIDQGAVVAAQEAIRSI